MHKVIVTGAGSGIGAAVSRLLLEQDVEVVAVDLRAESLAELEALGCTTVVADVSSAEGRHAVLAVSDWVDGLVNAAGVIRLVPVADVTDDDWDAILGVNLKAVFFLTRDLGATMPRGASIVNVASVAARYSATVETMCYGASKAGVLAVTRGLSYVLGARGVRVNAILPGIIETPMQEKVLDEIGKLRGVAPEALNEARLRLVPLEHRSATPAECARSIGFLLSEDASYITGQALAVDGGFTMF